MTNEMHDDRIIAIDAIINEFMRDYSRTTLIIDIASHDSLSDFIDAQIDDDFAIITESNDDAYNAYASIKFDDFALIALRTLMRARIYDALIA